MIGVDGRRRAAFAVAGVPINGAAERGGRRSGAAGLDWVRPGWVLAGLLRLLAMLVAHI